MRSGGVFSAACSARRVQRTERLGSRQQMPAGAGNGKAAAALPGLLPKCCQRVWFGQRRPVVMRQRAQACHLALVHRVQQPVHHRHQPGGDGQAFSGNFSCVLGQQASAAGAAIKPLARRCAAGDHILIQPVKLGPQARWRGP